MGSGCRCQSAERGNSGSANGIAPLVGRNPFDDLCGIDGSHQIGGLLEPRGFRVGDLFPPRAAARVCGAHQQKFAESLRSPDRVERDQGIDQRRISQFEGAVAMGVVGGTHHGQITPLAWHLEPRAACLHKGDATFLVAMVARPVCGVGGAFSEVVAQRGKAGCGAGAEFDSAFECQQRVLTGVDFGVMLGDLGYAEE